MSVDEQCPSSYCDLPKGHEGFHSTQTERDQCDDYFDVVMHEYSLKCDRSKGHDGVHGCVVISKEQPCFLEDASDRKIKIIAEWE
jgi:hypothetical protein